MVAKVQNCAQSDPKVTRCGTTLIQHGSLKSPERHQKSPKWYPTAQNGPVGSHSFCRNDRSQLIPTKGMVVGIQNCTKSDPKVVHMAPTGVQNAPKIMQRDAKPIQKEPTRARK